MESGRDTLLPLPSLVYNSVLSLMTSIIGVLRLVYPFGITMGAGWLEIKHPSLVCCLLMYHSPCLQMMLLCMLHHVRVLKLLLPLLLR